MAGTWSGTEAGPSGSVDVFDHSLGMSRDLVDLSDGSQGAAFPHPRPVPLATQAG